ncbi:EF-hand domain-containing protein [Aphelenchoides besseyi]|nr:EF-hand domain-containing protein [Aphelenchoides besseyi]KAI6235942.1 EF-hand domain-containing protein [Aphelenchoides besseyi]
MILLSVSRWIRRLNIQIVSTISSRRFYQPSNIYVKLIAVPLALGSGVFLGTRSDVRCLTNEDFYLEQQPIPRRLRRFLNFASVEFNGSVYMTPQDLLDSLILDEPRERVFRSVLTKQQVEKMLKGTPLLRKFDKDLFRQYLFLLTLLTKSTSSFYIAFAIFDDDNNQRISKEEFMKIRSLIVVNKSSADAERNHIYQTKSQFGLDIALLPLKSDVEEMVPKPEPLEQLTTLKSKLIKKTNDKTTTKTNTSPELPVDDGTQDTTILCHLFGAAGRNTLTFEQFQLFYNNLQAELIEIEFNEFARGKNEISAVDFARLVFRYTTLQSSDQLAYIKRITKALTEDEVGITLEQFTQFSKFLNNLEDFTRAIKLYMNANLDVSQNEFIRAVKCSTGLILDPHLVDVLFKIFDSNQDNLLQYSEFIAVMNDRLSRGFKNQTRKLTTSGWPAFKTCLIREMASTS